MLRFGELPDPGPGVGEVRVRIEAAGLNPRDVKRRGGVGDRVMTDPRVVPGDDGAGVIDQVGAGVHDAYLGRRVWVRSATFNRPFGTCAEYVVVPAPCVVELPPHIPFEQGACLGVPALTAHRSVYADGPIDGLTVLVTGGSGAVGHYAIELAKYGGARVIATASSPAKQQAALAAGADYVFDRRRPDIAAAILAAAGRGGVDRIVDVAFGANLAVSAAVIAPNGTIAAYASDAVPEPALPFYRLMRHGVSIRTVLVFIMPADAMLAASTMITKLLDARALTHPIAARYPLRECITAHEHQERGDTIGKIIITVR